MKKLSRTIFLASILSLSFFSCHEEINDVEPDIPEEPSSTEEDDIEVGGTQGESLGNG